MVEGATSGDVEDEVAPAAKSAEDRKAAAALSKLDASHHRDDEDESRPVDQEAVSRAMDRLGGTGGAEKKKAEEVAVKKVKVDPADVALVVSPSPFVNPPRELGWEPARCLL